MRFIADGPNIPDALLDARDAGQVLFFCGAGVSRHLAKLPDFAELAERVATSLGALPDGPARHLLDLAKPAPDGVKSKLTIAVDRVFSLLQQEFEVADVRRAVASALRSPEGCPLGAHETLLALSRVAYRPARLITTNFDRLFEAVEPDIRSSSPPRLPDPLREQDFQGIIHLHGAVSDDYSSAVNDEFVLSSAEFGHAYLSDGWATRYIQSLVQRFIIVFVGYSADDPPVQYLLEAMNRTNPGADRLYAFHWGTTEQAIEQWSHRGVTPIPFDTFDGLWTTLGAWAVRARDVEGWMRTVVDRGMQGPMACAPHERGMVAHLAKSVEGSRFLAISEPQLPAEWLFVFDRAMRYARPGGRGSDSIQPDPFDALGLDDDPPPSQIDTHDPFRRRDVPSSVWDAFDVAMVDRLGLSTKAYGQLTGWRGTHAGELPSRLSNLLGWIANVAHQPAVVAWLAGKQGLHHQVRATLQWRLRRKPSLATQEVLDAWDRVLASEPKRSDLAGPDPFVFPIAEWTVGLVRKAMGIYRPYIAVSHSSEVPWFSPPTQAVTSQLVSAEVEYPRPHREIVVPDAHLAYATRLLRGNVELAVQLGRELRGNTPPFFDALRPENEDAKANENAFRLTGLMATLANMTMRLAIVDSEAAAREVLAWAASNDPVFTRMRVWAAGYATLTTAEDAASILLQLSVEDFWRGHEERDLMYSLADRWDDFSEEHRRQLEWRLTTEDPPGFHDRNDRREVIAYFRLNRLQWLYNRGVRFGFDFAATMDSLRQASPSWTEDYVVQTARPRATRARWVGTDHDDEGLSIVPLENVVAVAEQESGYDMARGVEKNPFSGLVTRQPVRALRALGKAVEQGLYAPEAWSTFLYAQEQDSPSARLLKHTAHWLSQLPRNAFGAIAHPIIGWLGTHANALKGTAPECWNQLWIQLIAVVRDDTATTDSAAGGWVEDAQGRIAGRMTQLLLKDDRLDALTQGQGLPLDWKDAVEILLNLPAPHRLFVLTLLAGELTWLARTDFIWVEQQLLPWGEDDGQPGEAFWSGFLAAGDVPALPVFARMKPHMLAWIGRHPLGLDQPETLARMLLVAWRGDGAAHGVGQAVSDAELRLALARGGDELRRQSTWQLGLWAKGYSQEWADSILPFLHHAWPLQRSVRSEGSTKALIDLAFDVPETLFESVVDTILPRLTVIGASRILTPPDPDNLDMFVSTHPSALLKLLWVVVGIDAFDWPYPARRIVRLLAKMEPVAADVRLKELARRDRAAGAGD